MTTTTATSKPTTWDIVRVARWQEMFLGRCAGNDQINVAALAVCVRVCIWLGPWQHKALCVCTTVRHAEKRETTNLSTRATIKATSIIKTYRICFSLWAIPFLFNTRPEREREGEAEREREKKKRMEQIEKPCASYVLNYSIDWKTAGTMFEMSMHVNVLYNGSYSVYSTHINIFTWVGVCVCVLYIV